MQIGAMGRKEGMTMEENARLLMRAGGSILSLVDGLSTMVFDGVGTFLIQD